MTSDDIAEIQRQARIKARELREQGDIEGSLGFSLVAAVDPYESLRLAETCLKEASDEH